MPALVSIDRLRFLLNQLHERLWVRPLAVCLLSIAAVFIAKLADGTALIKWVPHISIDSVESLLSIMASSMLVIATFSVTSMLSAYNSASNSATPRAFRLMVADDVSQNALSTFVGAFIFSVVAIAALKNSFFDKAGLFILFALTVFVFGLVITVFVRWVDRIARLGRLGSTIEKVELATAAALERRRIFPTLCGIPTSVDASKGHPVFANEIGYVQHIDMSAIQAWADKMNAHVEVAALPGTFAAPNRVLAYVHKLSASALEHDHCIAEAFQIGRERLYADDPRFGLVVLSEIAGRALSPAVNDPGTAITITGALVRLIALWNKPLTDAEQQKSKTLFPRVAVPELTIRDLYDDAFTAIARDGAGILEVSVRLQKALQSLSLLGAAENREAARYHSQRALIRSEHALLHADDVQIIKDSIKPT
ncbi:DUF2254 domain-containing protein [Alishewanella sp. 16-MA]|uniref:DUF2254 domain-containing protein n=1 Tax=Alishewanella maricola TaxID=2795740 RepID=A0ABS8C6C8_9ALTE|nr:DUF2254 domain-containing protein [Alishewanella maricola]MCB5227685.1 DUF2254 domain-containing protein [Alishewanella maricola]